MRNIKKILLLAFLLVTLTSCASKCDPEEKNEFNELYKVNSTLVQSMTEDEVIEFTESKTGILFIGNNSEASKELAKILIDNLCECDVHKGHFIHEDDIKGKELLEKFDVKSLNYPIVAAYLKGELVAYYDANTKTDDVNDYIYNLVLAAYPSVCTEVC